MGGTPWEVPQTYEKWSPHNHIRNWKVRTSQICSGLCSMIDRTNLQTPELVIHGGLDYRLRRSSPFRSFVKSLTTYPSECSRHRGNRHVQCVAAQGNT